MQNLGNLPRTCLIRICILTRFGGFKVCLQIPWYFSVLLLLVVLVAQFCPTLCDPLDCSLSAPLSMGFSRQEHWSGLPFPSPGDLPDPGIKPSAPTLAGGFFTTEPPGKSKCLFEKWKWKSLSPVQLFATPWTIYSLWNSPGQTTGVGCHSFLQEIFPT